MGERLTLDDLPMLATTAMAAKVMGISNEKLKALINAGRLGYVLIGARKHVTPDAIRDFLATSLVKPCQDAIPAPAFDSSKSAIATTSAGVSMAAAASAAQAQNALKKLKSSSRTSFKNTPENGTARVVQMRSM